jgi:hypothetical protein
MSSQSRNPDNLRTLVRFPKNNDVCLFGAFSHFISRIVCPEHLIPHHNGPVAPFRTPNLIFVIRLRKEEFQAHFTFPDQDLMYPGGAVKAPRVLSQSAMDRAQLTVQKTAP